MRKQIINSTIFNTNKLPYANPTDTIANQPLYNAEHFAINHSNLTISNTTVYKRGDIVFGSLTFMLH